MTAALWATPSPGNANLFATRATSRPAWRRPVAPNGGRWHRHSSCESGDGCSMCRATMWWTDVVPTPDRFRADQCRRSCNRHCVNRSPSRSVHRNAHNSARRARDRCKPERQPGRRIAPLGGGDRVAHFVCRQRSVRLGLAAAERRQRHDATTTRRRHSREQARANGRHRQRSDGQPRCERSDPASPTRPDSSDPEWSRLPTSERSSPAKRPSPRRPCDRPTVMAGRR